MVRRRICGREGSGRRAAGGDGWRSLCDVQRPCRNSGLGTRRDVVEVVRNRGMMMMMIEFESRLDGFGGVMDSLVMPSSNSF
jgi:hypothetical protein